MTDLSWSTNTDWTTAQSTTNIDINSGTFELADAIPDSGDLQARYDFSQEDGTAPVTDQTGNGYDLSGTYSGVGGSINGLQAGVLDGVDDILSITSGWNSLPQPNTIYMVFQIETFPSTTNDYVFDGVDNTQALLLDADGSGSPGDDNLTIFAGSVLNEGTANTLDNNPHIIGTLFNGGSSAIRRDGSAIASGDAGSSSLDAFYLGSRGDGTSLSHITVGEILIYPQDKGGIQSDIEQYLGNKWGITI